MSYIPANIIHCMRKFLCILVTVFMLLPLVAGGNSETASVNADGTVNIDFWYAAAVTEAGPIPEDWVGYDIIRDKLGINLTLTMLPSSDQDQDVKLQAAGAANSLPDLMMIVNRPVLTNLVDQGLIASLDDDFVAQIPEWEAKYEDQDSINYTLIDGTRYGLAKGSSTIGVELLCIRKDWLDNLGLDVPKTLDEFFDVLYAFTYDDPDGNGLDDTYGYGAFIETTSTYKGYPGARFWPIMGAFDVPGLWDFTEGNVGLSFLEPGFYDFMQFVKKMQSEGVIDPNWMSYKKDDFRAAWKQGKFGVMYESWAALSAESNYAPFDANFPDGEWIALDPPVGPDGSAYVGALDKTYRILAISQKAKDNGKMEALAKLINWLGTDEAYYLLGYGVEGENYVFDENGNPSVGDLGENSYTGGVGQVMTQLRNIVSSNTNEETAIRFPDYIAATSQKVMSPIQFALAAEKGPWKNAVGSGRMPTPSGDVQRFYEQGMAEFLAGQRELTPESWQKFIDDFMKVGGEAWNQEGVDYITTNNLVIAD